MVFRTSSARWMCLLVLAAGGISSLNCTENGGANGGTGGNTPSTGGASGSGGAGSGGVSGSGGAGTGGKVTTGTGGKPVDAGPDVSGTGGRIVGGTGGASGTGGATATGCDTPGLTWKTARKTNYVSYPVPGSVECITFNGCEYQGLFAACGDSRKSKAWVMAHNIASVFPDRARLNLHDLCLKSGNRNIVVTVYDECADSDCDGCCTMNRANNDELIDLESFTDARFGVDDGVIQWADLGPTKGGGCSGN